MSSGWSPMASAQEALPRVSHSASPKYPVLVVLPPPPSQPLLERSFSHHPECPHREPLGSRDASSAPPGLGGDMYLFPSF